MSEPTKDRDQPYFYGSTAWIVGMIAAALLIWFMFSVADGFA